MATVAAKEKLIGIQRAAEMLGLQDRMVRAIAATGRIGRRVEGRWIFTESEVRELVRERAAERAAS